MNVAALPFVLPFLTAILLLIWRGPSPLRRNFILGSVIAQNVLAGWLIYEIFTTGKPLVLAIGGWTPPLGIVLVIDLLAAIMLLLAPPS